MCIVGTLYFTFIGSKMIPDTGYVPEFAQIEKKPLNKQKATIAALTMIVVLIIIASGSKALPMHVGTILHRCPALSWEPAA